MFKNMNIVIGVTGGIAAYKVCGLINYLKSEGANIDVIMTKSATNFISRGKNKISSFMGKRLQGLISIGGFLSLPSDDSTHSSQ